jgi:hypothetical protein
LWRFVTFRDWDPVYKWPFNNLSWQVANKVGYVTRADQVLYPYHYGIRKAALSDVLKKKCCKLMEVPTGPPEEKLEQFFTENYPNASLFSTGFYFIHSQARFFDHPIKLPILQSISESEFYTRWDALPSVVEPGDQILCTDTEAWISRTIARLDHGPWSHAATYIGSGLIVEAITSGVVCRELEAYRHPRFRFGIYRLEMSRKQQQEMIRWSCSAIGAGYDYYGLLRLSIWKLANKMPRPSELLVSPNDCAFFPPDRRLIYLV